MRKVVEDLRIFLSIRDSDPEELYRARLLGLLRTIITDIGCSIFEHMYMDGDISQANQEFYEYIGRNLREFINNIIEYERQVRENEYLN